MSECLHTPYVFVFHTLYFYHIYGQIIDCWCMFVVD